VRGGIRGVRKLACVLKARPKSKKSKFASLRKFLKRKSKKKAAKKKKNKKKG